MKILKFKEHNLRIEGEKDDIEQLVKILKEVQPEGAIGDILYQMELVTDEELMKEVE